MQKGRPQGAKYTLIGPPFGVVLGSFSLLGAPGPKKTRFWGVLFWNPLWGRFLEDLGAPWGRENDDFRWKGLQKSRLGQLEFWHRFGAILRSFWEPKTMLFAQKEQAFTQNVLFRKKCYF